MSKSLTPNASHPITTQILEKVKSIKVQLPDSISDKWAQIEQKEVALAVHIAELGYRYMDLRESLGHGKFLKALEERGTSKSRIYRYMDVAKFFSEVDDSTFPTLGNLKPSQIDELVKLPEPEKQALTPEKIEEFGAMSVRALRAEVKQLRLAFDEQNQLAAENQRLKQRTQQLEHEVAHQINLYNHELMKKAPERLYGLHTEVAFTRQKALVIGELLASTATELNALVQRCTQSSMAPELARDCALAINTSVSGQIMQLANSLTALRTSYDLDVLTLPDNLPVYSAQEVDDALRNAEYAKGEFLTLMNEIQREER